MSTSSYAGQSGPYTNMGHVQVYATAREVIGNELPERRRAKLWSQVGDEHALVIVAQILAELDEQSTLLEPSSDVDLRWAGLVKNKSLRDRLIMARKVFGNKILAPQIILLAIVEILTHCPSGPPQGTFDGLDIIMACMLGIGDEARARTDGVSWGGLDAGLAAELIANQNFHQSMSVAEQLAWVKQSWLQDWPETISEAERESVDGSPGELFREATSVDIEEFTAIATQLYAQYRLKGSLKFGPEFFEWTRVRPKATSYFLEATCVDVTKLRGLMGKERDRSKGSSWAFNTLRRFPLLRLSSGEVLILRLAFMVERALSETTYFDVKAYLEKYDATHGTRRRDAFKACTNGVLEAEVGISLRRIFKGRGKVFDERQMQRAFFNKKSPPKICDYAVHTKLGWIIVEVTNRSMTEKVVAAQGGAQELDIELNSVLIGRKLQQLASTIELLRSDSKSLTGRPSRRGDVYLPFVLTPPAGLPWNSAVHMRAHEKIDELEKRSSDDFASFALLRLRDLRILESAAEQGVDIVRVLKSWRLDAPSMPFSVFLAGRGVLLGHPKWVKIASMEMTNKIIEKIRSAEPGGGM